MPKVSVVIPSYNHARFLRQRVDSVLRQTFQDFELILLDDCSTDESRSILSEYDDDPRVRMEFNEKNSGSTFKQWNKGVQLARGEYIWIAESDDYADERLLERLVPVLESQPEAAFVYCRSWRVSEDDRLDGFADAYLVHLDRQRWTADYCNDGRDECRNYLVNCNTIVNASAVLFRRAVYEQVGGADESLRLGGDWKVWASMALTGRVAYMGEALNYFRFHNASVRNQSKYAGIDTAESLQVVRWILSRVTPKNIVREKLCRLYASYWVPAVMSRHVALSLKLAILRDVRVIDPHPMRRAVRPAFVNLRLKFERIIDSFVQGSKRY